MKGCLTDKEILMGSPQLSIITGPINSGKMRLIERVLLDLLKKTKLNTVI